MSATALLRLAMTGRSKSGLTNTYSVFSAITGCYLGQVRWYGQWRKYCFFPTNDVLFDEKCLRSMADSLSELMRERRNAARDTEVA